MRHMYFVGVSTAHSSIMTIFPAWAQALGLQVEMRGLDLSLDAPPARFREALTELAADPLAAGALVTTHKAAIYDAAVDMFSDLDDWARLCREVSCVAVRSSVLFGWAKDPITARQAYTHLLGENSWSTTSGSSSDVVCLGSGGAGLALTVAILGSEHQPRRYLLTDKDPRRLASARETLGHLDVRAELELHVVDGAGATDALVESAAPGSLVVNATGMGKDLPGSPVSGGVVFPREAVVWDMNYRGELQFLDIAHRQADTRGLVVSDGWQYFLHGWTEVIAEVFDVRVDEAVFRDLKRIAEQVTGRTASVAAAGAEVNCG